MPVIVGESEVIREIIPTFLEDADGKEALRGKAWERSEDRSGEAPQAVEAWRHVPWSWETGSENGIGQAA